MGRNSSGVRGSSGGTKEASTERGYSEALRKAVTGREAGIRSNRNESVHVFDASGKELSSSGGRGAEVKLSKATMKAAKDNILTHNHPRSIGESGLLSIGNSFSKADLATAVDLDVAEIRAVTPTYTFSMKRPKGGWGVTARQVRRAYDDAAAMREYKGWQYIYGGRDDREQEQRMVRTSATHWHDVNKAVAAKFGWEYTKKKG